MVKAMSTLPLSTRTAAVREAPVTNRDQPRRPLKTGLSPDPKPYASEPGTEVPESQDFSISI